MKRIITHTIKICLSINSFAEEFEFHKIRRKGKKEGRRFAKEKLPESPNRLGYAKSRPILNHR